MLALGGKRILPSLLFYLAIPYFGGYNTREINCEARNIMEKNEKKKSKLMSMIAPEETPEQAALREACDAYIVQACDRIRQDMEREKAANPYLRG